jgi:hypothetical protein
MTIEEKIKELVLWSSFSCMEDANSWADDAAKFLRENQEAILSALADQRRYRVLRNTPFAKIYYNDGFELLEHNYNSISAGNRLDDTLDQEGE